MSGRRDLRSKIASYLELPGDVMLDVARISIVGDLELLVENHRGVTEYTAERVALAIPQGQVSILGDNLTIGSISPDQVLIRGKIRAVQYL